MWCSGECLGQQDGVCVCVCVCVWNMSASAAHWWVLIVFMAQRNHQAVTHTVLVRRHRHCWFESEHRICCKIQNITRLNVINKRVLIPTWWTVCVCVCVSLITHTEIRWDEAPSGSWWAPSGSWLHRDQIELQQKGNSQRRSRLSSEPRTNAGCAAGTQICILPWQQPKWRGAAHLFGRETRQVSSERSGTTGQEPNLCQKNYNNSFLIQSIRKL